MNAISTSPCGIAVVAQHAQDLANDRAARLVVAAEHGRAVAPDDVAFDDRPDALARDHGVHVRREEERRRGDRARDAREHVAGRAADLGARVVDPDLGAEVAELAREPLGHAVLLPRMAVDADQLEEEGGQTFA